MWTGCSSSEESIDDEFLADIEENDTPSVDTTSTEPVTKPPAKSSSSSQQFSVKADTVDVQSKKKQGKKSSSISVKASAPKRFYTVEIGAFRLQGNVKRHQEQLTKRFNLPVRVMFDSSISLTRVCVGTFSTKKTATVFMNTMKEKYPKDYPDLWVNYWTK